MTKSRGTSKGPKSSSERSRSSGAGGAAHSARLAALLLVAAAILFVGSIRVRYADLPLERDEGEYAYAGQLILQGVPPYQQAFNMKFPGTYYTFALLMGIFGQTTGGIRAGLILVNTATILLVFAIGRRVMGDMPGAAAATAFALMSLDPWPMATFAHATHFVLLPALAGLLFALIAGETGRPWLVFAAGALLGTSVLMKQHAAIYLAVGAVVLLRIGGPGSRRETVRTGALRVLILAAGAALPFLSLCALFSAQGVLGSFWFWTFEYAWEYVTRVPSGEILPMLRYALGTVTRAAFPFWIAGIAGIVALWLTAWPPRTRLFLTALFAGSALAVCPGFYFREHYFIVMLPPLALLSAVFIVSLARAIEGRAGRSAALAAGAGLFAAAILVMVLVLRGFLFEMTPRDLSRTRYGSNPFIETVEIATYLREHTSPDDRIAVLGSEPQVYFYANRRSATGYIYMYPLMEPQKFASRMQEEMIREIEKAHPAYIVFAQIRSSWLPQPGSDKRVIDWGNRYTQTCYDIAGVADIHSRNVTGWAWGDEARVYEPKSQNLVYVFRRKSDAPCTAGS